MIYINNIGLILGIISSVVTIIGCVKNINYMKLFLIIVIGLFSKEIIIAVGLFQKNLYLVVLLLEIIALGINYLKIVIDGIKLNDIFQNDFNGFNTNYVILSILPLIFILTYMMVRLFVKPDLLVGDIPLFLQKLSNMKINVSSYKYMFEHIKITLYLVEATLQLI